MSQNCFKFIKQTDTLDIIVRKINENFQNSLCATVSGLSGLIGISGVSGISGLIGQSGLSGTSGILPSGSTNSVPFWDGTQWVVNSTRITASETGNTVSLNTGVSGGQINLQTGANQITLRTSNADRWYIKSSGALEYNGSTGDRSIQTTTGDFTITSLAGNGNIILNSHGTGEVRFSINNTLRWFVDLNGAFNSNGAQTIRSSTGALTVTTGGGNGALILGTNGTGTIQFNPGSTNRWTIDANGILEAAGAQQIRTATGNLILNAGSTGILDLRTAGTTRWSITNAGILESNGVQTVRTSTGNLTLATNAGNGNIILSPHGTGRVVYNAPSGSTELSTLVLNGSNELLRRALTTTAFTSPSQLNQNTYRFLLFGESYMLKFRDRVILDSGSYFSNDSGFKIGSLKSNNFLNRSTLIVSPSATKLNKIYTLKPNNASFDIFLSRAGNASFIDEDNILTNAAADIPRIDYTNNGTGALLIEDVRTNSIRNNFGVGAVIGTGTFPTNWTDDSTVGSFGLIARIVATGTTNGIRWTDIRFSGTSNNNGQIYLAFESLGFINATTGQTWTTSFYAQLVGATGATPTAFRVLNNFWSISPFGFISTDFVNISLTNFLTRYSRTTQITDPSIQRIQPAFAFTPFTSGNFNFIIRIGLPQCERGGNVSSLITTTGSTVSRVADFATLTGATSLIGATEGTLYAEIDYESFTNTTDRFILDIRDTINNSISLIASGTAGRLTFDVSVSGSTQCNIQSNSNTTGFYKIAGAYRLNDFVFYVNGIQAGVDSSGSIPEFFNPIIGFGNRGDSSSNSQYNGNIRNFILFPHRLTNNELITLTTI